MKGKLKDIASLKKFRVPDKTYNIEIILKTDNLEKLDPKISIINTFDADNKPIVVHEGENFNW